MQQSFIEKEDPREIFDKTVSPKRVKPFAIIAPRSGAAVLSGWSWGFVPWKNRKKKSVLTR
eukprot:9218122-Pyramimonas_sp.AAC.1